MNQHLFKIALISSLLGMTTICSADDSEIFFNESIKHVKPNVIFVLDASGSMAWDTNNEYTNTRGVKSRMEMLKSSLNSLLSQSSVSNIRAGIIRFSDNSINKNALYNIQSVIDIDDSSGNSLINQVTLTNNKDNTTTLIQPVLTNIDDGWQKKLGNNYRSCLMQALREEYFYAGSCSNNRYNDNNYYKTQTYQSGMIISYRFNGILIKPTTPSEIKSAYLNIALAYNSPITDNKISLAINNEDNAPYFTENWNVLGEGLSNSKSTTVFNITTSASSTNPSDGNCVIFKNGYSSSILRCNVTSFIQNKIAQTGWQAGNAIAFYLTNSTANYTFWFKENPYYTPNLEITANTDEVVKDRTAFTNRNQLISQAYNITPYDGTYIGYALYQVARYISTNNGSTGPYHSDQLAGASPLLEGCQLTHLILMTDGEPSGSSNTEIASYISQSTNNCYMLHGKNSDGSLIKIYEKNLGVSPYGAQSCARALVSWMSRTDHASKYEGANYIRTNTIGFALSNNAQALSYLEDLAKYGDGQFYEVNAEEDLLAAFKKIISDARAADAPSASGQVTMSAQSRYQQRTEVFYSFYSSDALDYWPGNMKRFALKYVQSWLTNGDEATRPILVGEDLTTPAMAASGIIKTDASSFWKNSNQDGGKVDSGGVLGMLMYKTDSNGKELVDPTLRNMLLARTNAKTLTSLKESSASITTEELGLKGTNTDLGLTATNTIEIKTRLLNFIRGYDYLSKDINDPTAVSTGNKKIGDAAKSSVTLINYNCDKADDKGKEDITSCLTVNQVALLASNDGLFRGYNAKDGTALYEIMPEEMLPLIKNLQIRKTLNFQTPRSYGLDGTAVTYLTNNSDYVKGSNGLSNDAAYAYIATGRGGKFIYAFNISNIKSPAVAWTIPKDSPGDFANLGFTWSTPVLGKIRSGGKIIPVLVFGGGYDKDVNDKVDNTAKGNSIYIVNAIDGKLIKAIHEPGMDYSIPSRVALITDDGKDNKDNQKLITEIIVGDTGGQVWRFNVSNGSATTATAVNITPDGHNGIIAKLAGAGSRDGRQFFQAPAASVETINGVKTLVIGLGSGNRVHPVSKDVDDRIYLLKYPLDAGQSKLITEDDLAVVSSSGQTAPTGNMDNGFMIKLSEPGEKVVSDGIAVFDRIVFNTYTPTPTNIQTCTPSSGAQRTYNYGISTGVSLLTGPFEKSDTVALPPDVTFYCDAAFCTIISSPKQLAPGDDVLSKGKGNKDPWTERNPDGSSGSLYKKAGWTDIFDITP